MSFLSCCLLLVLFSSTATNWLDTLPNFGIYYIYARGHYNLLDGLRTIILSKTSHLVWKNFLWTSERKKTPSTNKCSIYVPRFYFVWQIFKIFFNVLNVIDFNSYYIDFKKCLCMCFFLSGLLMSENRFSICSSSEGYIIVILYILWYGFCKIGGLRSLKYIPFHIFRLACSHSFLHYCHYSVI